MADEEKERRIELAAKVQVLDERTHHITKAVDRIEKHLENHTKEEEAAFHNFYRTKAEMIEIVGTFKDSIDTKLDETLEKIHEKLEPIQDDFRKIKTVYKVAATIGSALLAIIVFFKDEILRYFH